LVHPDDAFDVAQRNQRKEEFDKHWQVISGGTNEVKAATVMSNITVAELKVKVLD